MDRLAALVPDSLAEHGVELLHAVEVGVGLVARVRVGVVQPTLHELHDFVFVLLHPPHELAVRDQPVAHHLLEVFLAADPHVRVFAGRAVDEAREPLGVLVDGEDFFNAGIRGLDYCPVCRCELFDEERVFVVHEFEDYFAEFGADGLEK